MESYIGKMLDNRYEILEHIGTGGMAVVYKAKCHRLNRLVAVKVLKSDLAGDADFRRRFRCYAAILSQIGITAAAPHEWNPSLLARATGTLSFMNNNVRNKPKK